MGHGVVNLYLDLLTHSLFTQLVCFHSQIAPFFVSIDICKRFMSFVAEFFCGKPFFEGLFSAEYSSLLKLTFPYNFVEGGMPKPRIGPDPLGSWMDGNFSYFHFFPVLGLVERNDDIMCVTGKRRESIVLDPTKLNFPRKSVRFQSSPLSLVGRSISYPKAV